MKLAKAGKRPVWAETEMRLDPFLLPQKTSYARREANGGSVTFTVDIEGAVMKRKLNCGLPLSMALPAKAFRGVAARAFEGDDGKTMVTLELLHADEAMSVPLLVSDNMDDVAADWHSWSRTLRLPMLMIAVDGAITRVQNTFGLVRADEPSPRRRRHNAVKRRPRFLMRRKSGVVGDVVKLTPDEIIARN
jgi:hypothetical protein